YQVFDIKKKQSLAKGVVERIGQAGSTLCHQKEGSPSLNKNVLCNDHHAAIGMIVSILSDKRYGVISSKGDIAGIGHRVVHGGEEFKESSLITAKVLRSIQKYSDLAPLHNPPALLGIEACLQILKGVPQAAVFDTSFHQTMPEVAFLYGLPFEYYKNYGIRRYGFHGTSHKFVTEEAGRILKRPLKSLKLITCHLGNGCSMTAVDGGKSVDTSMGFTPLEGLLMGTRSGDLDPAAVLYLLEKENLSFNRVNDILNKESGLLGISGVSNDMRDILKASKGRGEKALRSKLAIDMFIYRAKKYIGSYQAVLGRLDAVIFTAGIGEHNPWLVKRIMREIKGIVGRKVRFLIIPTNEELLIAHDTYQIVKDRSY
ncbi:MAG: acetate kinase, partial [Candidatus Omnitrophica bacterium]|nr:acetate kinase [Candidatus Omnitrophota bacterium]